MLPIRTSLLCESSLVESLVYFSSLHPQCASQFQSSHLSIFRAYILALRVNFSRVSCLFFEPASSLHESIFVESLVYFLSLHPRFVSLFFTLVDQNRLALRVYFSRVELNRTQEGRDRLRFSPLANSRWLNKCIYFMYDNVDEFLVVFCSTFRGI